MEPIRTRVGWADFGDYEHYGRRLYAELLGSTSFLGLVVFAIRGRSMATEDVAVLDDLAVALHVPEPRVWPLKGARVGASTGRFMTGLTGACAMMDSSDIGIHVVARSARLYLDLAAALEGADDRAAAMERFVDERQVLPGFGVYGRRVDERIAAMQRMLVARGRRSRPWFSLAESLWPLASERKNLDAHAWSAVAAVLLDLGLTPEEMPPLLTIMLQSSYLAHVVEGAKLRSPALRELSPEAIRYVGPEPRRSPRQRSSDG